MVEHRLKGSVGLYEERGGELVEMGWPVTNMVLVGERAGG
jgi:hypothetical protein